MCEFCFELKDIRLTFYVCKKCEKEFYNKERLVDNE
jgi:hypothetical protein